MTCLGMALPPRSITVWSKPDVVQVPTSALFRVGDTWAVFAVTDDRATTRTVESGHRGPLQTEIVRGLEVGGSVDHPPRCGDSRWRPGCASLAWSANAARSFGRGEIGAERVHRPAHVPAIRVAVIDRGGDREDVAHLDAAIDDDRACSNLPDEDQERHVDTSTRSGANPCGKPNIPTLVTIALPNGERCSDSEGTSSSSSPVTNAVTFKTPRSSQEGVRSSACFVCARSRSLPCFIAVLRSVSSRAIVIAGFVSAFAIATPKDRAPWRPR